MVAKKQSVEMPEDREGSVSRTQDDKSADFAILDYWRWAYSDLLDNAARGVVAEFLVRSRAQARRSSLRLLVGRI